MKKFAIFFEDIQSPMENQGELHYFDNTQELSEILQHGFFLFEAADSAYEVFKEENEEDDDSDSDAADLFEKFQTEVKKSIDSFCSQLTEVMITPELSIDIDYSSDWNIHFVGKTELFAHSEEDFPAFVRAEYRGYFLGEPIGRGPIPEEERETFFEFLETHRV